MTSGGPKWEDLRREARQLENEIDIKLVTFSKLSAELAGSSQPISSDKQPLLGAEHSVENVESEIEKLLTSLSDVNERMSEFVSSAGVSAAVQHTRQRHRDILHDYKSEFSRTGSSVHQAQQRRQLLATTHSRSADDAPKSGGLNRRMDHLLKEHDHIRNSDRLIDEQIAIAMETREQMSSQRVTFKAIQTRVNDLTHKFPMINSLIQRAQLRKRRDALVMAVVVSLCLIVFIWHLFG